MVAEKESNRQIVFDNLQEWTARIRIENDSESRRLILKHTKNQITWKSMRKSMCVHIFKHTILWLGGCVMALNNQKDLHFIK